MRRSVIILLQIIQVPWYLLKLCTLINMQHGNSTTQVKLCCERVHTSVRTLPGVYREKYSIIVLLTTHQTFVRGANINTLNFPPLFNYAPLALQRTLRLTMNLWEQITHQKCIWMCEWDNSTSVYTDYSNALLGKFYSRKTNLVYYNMKISSISLLV